MKSSNAGHGVQVAGKSMRVLDTAQAAQVAQEHQEGGYGPDWPIPAPPATRPQAIVLASVSLSMAGVIFLSREGWDGSWLAAVTG